MLICHIIIDLDIGGAELALKRLVLQHTAHSQAQHIVISLTSLGSIGAELVRSGFVVHSLGAKNPLDFPVYFFKLTRRLADINPDIVQTWMYHSDLIGGLAARFVGVSNVIWGVRSTDIRQGGSKLTPIIRKICAFFSRHVPDVIVCAANTSRFVHEQVGYASSKMHVIPNGFELERSTFDKSLGDAVRLAAGILPGDCVIGSVGRFSPVKDHALFIESAARLLTKHSNLKFLLVGRGLDQQNQALMSMIDKTGHTQAFVLLGERDDVPACMMAMNIFCLHSRTEGFPNVLGEAMALGLPCVTTDVGDAAFLLGGHGLVVPSNDPAALANALDNMLSMDTLILAEMGAAAKTRIVSEFSMQAMTDRFHQLYMKLNSK